LWKSALQPAKREERFGSSDRNSASSREEKVLQIAVVANVYYQHCNAAQSGRGWSLTAQGYQIKVCRIWRHVVVGDIF